MIKIGTRPSKLAVAQAMMVSDKLRSSGYETEIIEHRSAGDIDRDTPIYSINRTGVFVNDLNDLILEGKIDIAVHSAKDIPYDIPEKLGIAAVLERGPYSDCLVAAKPLMDLDPGSRIGTSSIRRMYEIRTVRNDLKIENVRGNIETRLGRVSEGALDGVIMAEAGIVRLGLDIHYERLGLSNFIPSPNQGIIAVVGRKGEYDEAMMKINDRQTYDNAMIERSVMKSLKLGCSTPVGILSTSEGSGFSIMARFYSLRSPEFTDIRYHMNDRSDVDDLIRYIKDEIPENYGYIL
ncbi:MAG: hydroxymethylbilane synthase [Thermoplasmata archaeon]